MARIPLNALPAFRMVAELTSLRAAAAKLHITHSAVSQQIRTLEDQIGFQLFERRGRKVVLNPAGAVLLRSVQAALTTLDEGVQSAEATALGTAQRLRITVLPSFAQRWLLPRMVRWRKQYPKVSLEIDASQQLVDLQREGFHAALRQGKGPWPGNESFRLFESPMPWIVVGTPAAGKRLRGKGIEALTREPLLGESEPWERLFAQAGVRTQVTPVAVFNDFGMMLQAAEQDLGLALVRELLAADAIATGRLVRLSPLEIAYEQAQTYHLVYPPSLRDWPPLLSLRAFLQEEFDRSHRQLHPPEKPPRARTIEQRKLDPEMSLVNQSRR